MWRKILYLLFKESKCCVTACLGRVHAVLGSRCVMQKIEWNISFLHEELISNCKRTENGATAEYLMSKNEGQAQWKSKFKYSFFGVLHYSVDPLYSAHALWRTPFYSGHLIREPMVPVPATRRFHCIVLSNHHTVLSNHSIVKTLGLFYQCILSLVASIVCVHVCGMVSSCKSCDGQVRSHWV